MKAFIYMTNEGDAPVEVKNLSVIGSGDNVQIQLPDPDVSGRHCRIELRDTGYWLVDLRSTRGTFVNGELCYEKLLSEGDIIRVCQSELMFSLSSEPVTSDLGLSSRNKPWNERLKTLGSAAKTDFSILLLGPSGSGKEILAEAIHKNSGRKGGPFVSVNCSALTETLIESELFGHIKGSFTGASADRKGAFEAARGGSLFLDEIGDLPYPMQAKLLRALENQEIRPVGADRTIKTDVRIIAATHQNLTAKIKSQEFRADLFYRLNVVKVEAPGLNDRMEDFDDLLHHFAKKLKVRFSYDGILELRRHSWPGNIRELKNAVSRASALYPKVRIEAKHIAALIDILPEYPMPAVAGAAQMDDSVRQAMPAIKEIEKQLIIKRLAANHGNQRRTASDLGIPKSTLHDRLRTYKINPKEYNGWSQVLV